MRKIKLDRISKSYRGYPFNVPFVQDLQELVFDTPITFLIGENGSGKSTLLESIAIGIDSISIGSEELKKDNSLNRARNLAKELKFIWDLKTQKGFFLRAEDVFGFTKNIKNLAYELDSQASKYNGDDYGSKLARGSILGQKKGLENRYGKDLDANSHGETFLKLFKSRFVPGGIYLLDEPESPLSFSRQLGFLILLREMVQQKAQFIIVTHSPIICSLPEASIYSLDNNKLEKVKYKDIEQFKLMKDFLSNPERFLKHL